jgi:hypothetical protein
MDTVYRVGFWVMLIWVCVLSIYTCRSVRDVGGRYDDLQWRSEEVLSRLLQGREEMMYRDSILLDRVRVGEERIGYWVGKMVVERNKVGAYSDSIRVELVRRDSISSVFLNW